MNAAAASLPSPGSVQGLKVIDFGLGLTAALIAKQFAELGARVSRIEPAGGDPFYDVYPAYRHWRRRELRESADRTESILENADLCIVGGEDFPGIAHEQSAESISRRYPRLVVLRILSYPDDAARRRPAVDLLVQARTGMVYEQFSERPIAASIPLAGYGAALQGLIGCWVALIERERSELGQMVTVSLAAGAAMFWGPFWMKAEKADAGFAGITPRDVRHLILRCAGDEFVHLTFGVPGALAKAYKALGITDAVDPADRGMPDPARGAANFYGNIDLLNSFAHRHTRPNLIRALREAGVPAEAVLAPGDCWSDEQTRINGIIEQDETGWSGVGSPLRFVESAKNAAQPPKVSDPSAPPLAGIRVIDFGVFVAGPYASKLLADYGADVIQVEPPTGRSTLSGERTIISAIHGKRSICIDAKSEAGRALVAVLCKDADVVSHNFRPGVADRLGLDRRSLRALNPAVLTLGDHRVWRDRPQIACAGLRHGHAGALRPGASRGWIGQFPAVLPRAAGRLRNRCNRRRRFAGRPLGKAQERPSARRRDQSPECRHPYVVRARPRTRRQLAGCTLLAPHASRIQSGRELVSNNGRLDRHCGKIGFHRRRALAGVGDSVARSTRGLGRRRAGANRFAHRFLGVATPARQAGGGGHLGGSLRLRCVGIWIGRRHRAHHER